MQQDNSNYYSHYSSQQQQQQVYDPNFAAYYQQQVYDPNSYQTQQQYDPNYAHYYQQQYAQGSIDPHSQHYYQQQSAHQYADASSTPMSTQVPSETLSASLSSSSLQTHDYSATYGNYYAGSGVESHAATNEEASIRKDLIEMHVSNGVFNLNEILANNIVMCAYYKDVMQLVEFSDICDEITRQVTHLEPYVVGKQRLPSTAFCLLYRLFCVKITKRQMHKMLTSSSPYIRGIGFLYLRFVADPKTLWDWFDPYLDDNQEFAISGDGTKITIGKFLEQLLCELNYFTTVLPRIPIPVSREWKVKLVERDVVRQRSQAMDKLRPYFKPGTRCQALYSGDGKYYDARVDKVLENGLFIITYLEYNEQEEVEIGRLKLNDEEKQRIIQTEEKRSRGQSRSNQTRSRSRDRRYSRSRSRSRDHRRSRSRSPLEEPDFEKIQEEVLRRERDKFVAHGRSDYAKRPTSYKTALSMKLDVATARKRSRSPPSRTRRDESTRSQQSSLSSLVPAELPKKEVSAEHRAKLLALKAKYGDASAQKNTSDF